MQKSKSLKEGKIYINMKAVAEKKRKKRIKNLRTYVPFGFNKKLNHPTWRNKKLTTI